MAVVQWRSKGDETQANETFYVCHMFINQLDTGDVNMSTKENIDIFLL